MNNTMHTIVALFKDIGVVQVVCHTVVLIFNSVPIDRIIGIHGREGGKCKGADEESSMASWRYL